jgi:hypothetical protein
VAGSLAYGSALSLTGIGATSSAGTLAPDTPTGAALTGMEIVSSLGVVNISITRSIGGEALTSAQSSIGYSASLHLAGVSAGAALGVLGAGGGDTVASLTGIPMVALPGNVRVTGGTRWVPQAPRPVTLPTAVGNTLPPPPRLTGNVEVDMRSHNQWLATLYDQMVKVNNIFGRVADHEARIAALEADNDNET